ncbi:MAG: phosphate signaling complex protein PhoU [Pirellulales bacterium]|nr:phosphate signaling complex protein PhoU [Pirellulales bacterium]
MSLFLLRDLETLHRDLLSMSAAVEDMIYKAVERLARPSEAFAGELAERDEEIDRWDVKIEEECLKILALHQPVATDLRRITTVMKITSELERVADLSVHIAERASEVMPGAEIAVLDRLKEMARISIDMVHSAINAYVAFDAQSAREVCVQDEQVDEMNREIIQELIETMKQSPELIEAALHLFSASRHLERIADHATNIAEDVVYLVEGDIVRHEPMA